MLEMSFFRMQDAIPYILNSIRHQVSPYRQCHEKGAGSGRTPWEESPPHKLIHVDRPVQNNDQFWRAGNGFSISIQSPIITFSMTDKLFWLSVFLFQTNYLIFVYIYTVYICIHISQTLHRPWHETFRFIDDWLLQTSVPWNTFQPWLEESISPVLIRFGDGLTCWQNAFDTLVEFVPNRRIQVLNRHGESGNWDKWWNWYMVRYWGISHSLKNMDSIWVW